MTMQSAPIWRQVFGFPRTLAGRIAVGLVGLHVVFMLLWSLFHRIRIFGQPGGPTFFSNPTVASMLLLAGAAAVAAGAAAVFAIVARRERSIVDALIVLFGLFVLAFALGEVLVPH
jgi:hypothetical protein